MKREREREEKDNFLIDIFIIDGQGAKRAGLLVDEYYLFRLLSTEFLVYK